MLNRVGPNQGTNSLSDRDVTPPATAQPGQWMDKPPGVREIHHYGPGMGRPRPNVHAPENPAPVSDRISAGSLVVAGLLIAVGIVGGIWVVYDAQFQFALLHNHENETAAHIQAAVPELVWIAMALVGLSQALRGRKSARVTSHILLFFSLSMGAQLMYAMPNPGGYLVAIITPLALAILLETFIDGVYRWAKSRDGEPPEERSILATVGKVLRRVPKLFWLLPIALLVGFVLDFHGTAQGTRAVLLAVVPWTWLILLAYPLAWLIRLWLDKESTKTGLADWLKDHIPYAPGRTKVQDDARRAREDAEMAARKLQSAEQMAAEMVRKAERDRDQAIADQRAEHIAETDRLGAEFAEQMAELRRTAAENLAEQREAFTRQIGELEERLHSLDEGSGAALRKAREDAQRQLGEARAEFARMREADRQEADQRMQGLQADYERKLSAANAQAADAVQQLRASSVQVRELTAQVEKMRGAASGRDRLIWAYEALQRRGDHRFGDRAEVRTVVRELLEDPEIGLQSVNTACNYVTAYLDENPHLGQNAFAGMS